MKLRRNSALRTLGPLLCGLLSTAAVAHARPSQDALDRAQKLLLEGKAAEAAALLEPLRDTDPRRGDVERLLGRSYLDLGRREDARRALLRALGEGRLTDDVLSALAHLDSEDGRTASLETSLRLLVLLHPGETTWRKLLATELARAGAFEEARALLRSCAEDDPTDPDTWQRLADCALRTGDAHEAALALETAQALGGEDEGSARTLADAWSRAHDPARALVWLERARVLLGDAVPLELELRRVELLGATGRTPEARALGEAHFAELTADDPRRAVLAEHLAQWALDAGDSERALELLIGLGDDAPARVLEVRATLHRDRGETQASLETLERATAAKDARASSLDTLCLWSLEAGDLDRARRALRHRVALFGPDDTVLGLVRRIARATSTAPSGN